MPTSEWQWRIPTVLMSVFSLFMMALYPFVPNSPRWLISKGRDEEAHAIFAKYHANGDMEDQLVQAEMLEIKETFAMENALQGQTSSWKECFATPGNKWRMLICVGLATCNNWNGQSEQTSCGLAYSSRLNLCRYRIVLQLANPHSGRDHRHTLSTRYQWWSFHL